MNIPVIKVKLMTKVLNVPFRYIYFVKVRLMDGLVDLL